MKRSRIQKVDRGCALQGWSALISVSIMLQGPFQFIQWLFCRMHLGSAARIRDISDNKKITALT